MRPSRRLPRYGLASWPRPAASARARARRVDDEGHDGERRRGAQHDGHQQGDPQALGVRGDRDDEGREPDAERQRRLPDPHRRATALRREPAHDQPSARGVGAGRADAGHEPREPRGRTNDVELSAAPSPPTVTMPSPMVSDSRSPMRSTTAPHATSESVIATNGVEASSPASTSVSPRSRCRYGMRNSGAFATQGAGDLRQHPDGEHRPAVRRGPPHAHVRYFFIPTWVASNPSRS